MPKPKMTQWNVAYRKDQGEGVVNTPTIGRAFQTEKTIKVRLDSMPITRFWKDGELILFPIKNEEDDNS